MSKETFKLFARKHPELADNVLKGSISWQQFYELYEIYGENNSIWNKYFEKEEKTTFKDLFNTFKNLDIESIQTGITNIEDTIKLLRSLGLGSNKNIYTPKPIYKKFEE